MKYVIPLLLLPLFSCRNESEQTPKASIEEPKWSSNHSVDFNQEDGCETEFDSSPIHILYSFHKHGIKYENVYYERTFLFIYISFHNLGPVECL